MHLITVLWAFYHTNKEIISPLLGPTATLVGTGATLGVGIALARAALEQARISTVLAEVALRRHEEQTNADRQRRITESFAKAVEQLGSDKLQTRLGGIFTIERIARESEEDHWSSMEILAAFVRERVAWERPTDIKHSAEVAIPYLDPNETTKWPEFSVLPDVETVLKAIRRRTPHSSEREFSRRWVIDLSRCDLRGVSLSFANLNWVNFSGSNLEGAQFDRSTFEGAMFVDCYLQGASFLGCKLRAASFAGAQLQGVDFNSANLHLTVLNAANLEGACLYRAVLDGALLDDRTCINGVDFRESSFKAVWLDSIKGLSSDQIASTSGDERTILPEGLKRPSHWPPLWKEARPKSWQRILSRLRLI